MTKILSNIPGIRMAERWGGVFVCVLCLCWVGEVGKREDVCVCVCVCVCACKAANLVEANETFGVASS